MLPAPAREDARAFTAKVRRLADSERTRRLDALERLWKGKQYSDRPSFWDPEVPLNERAPCVQSSVAETAGGRLVSLVFGNARFPALKVADGAYSIEFVDAEREQISALVAQIVSAAHLKSRMRQALEQGLMCGTLVLLASVQRGHLAVQLLPAKWCERTLDAAGDVTALEIRYRHDVTGRDGSPRTVWYRRVIDAALDTTWDGVPADADGYLPDWDRHSPIASVEHGLGFCPVLWHRNAPDVSDNDPADGSALFDGLENEIFGLDIAMSQRHRNGRYNGEPQLVRIGFGDERTLSPMGEVGRTADPSAGGFSWLGDRARRLFGGGTAIKKAPGKIWDAPKDADVKMLESTGAGAQILAADIDGLKRIVLEARGIVIASPETVSANASAALLKELYAPMVAVADNYRDEYGDVLVAVINLLLRVAYTTEVHTPRSVRMRGLASAMPVLAKLVVPMVDGSREWSGVPLEPQWGEYFEPTWQDVAASIGAATAGVAGGVLSRRSAVRMVAPVVGIDDVDAELDAIDGVQATDRASARDLLGTLAVPGGTAEATADPGAAKAQGAAAAQGELPEVFGYDYDAGIITVDEARARKGLPALPNGEGTVSVLLYKAIQEAKAAEISPPKPSFGGRPPFGS